MKTKLLLLATSIAAVALYFFEFHYTPPSVPLLPVASSTNKGNHTIETFREAKKLGLRIYQAHQLTFYCNCTFSRGHINHDSCGYTPKSDVKRAARLEWEHVVPAHDFGQHFVEWREGHDQCVNKKSGKRFRGRRCAQLVSEEFRRMEADLYNLVPEVGEINAMRGNSPMGLLESGEAANLTPHCATKITKDMIEPRPEVRGFVARVYFYMADAYPQRHLISRKNQKLFQAWNKMYPPDTWEKRRAQLIANIQKNLNPFVMEYQQKLAAQQEP